MRKMNRTVLVSAAMALGGIGIARDAKATAQCYNGSGDQDVQDTNTDPSVYACEFPYPLVSGSGAVSVVIQDQTTSSASGTYALEANSLKNTAILGLVSGGSGFGVEGYHEGAGGTGLYGDAIDTTAANWGVQAAAAGPGGYGVSAIATDTSSTSNYGVRGQADSPNGYGVFGQATGTSGIALDGDGTLYGCEATANSSIGAGGYFINNNTSGGKGVFGQSASTSTTTTFYGVYGAADATGSSQGMGVYGIGSNVGVEGYTATNGLAGVAGYGTTTGSSGVYGKATGSGSANAGIYGDVGGSATYAGYFNGPVKITGALTVEGSACCASDARLKKDVKALDGVQAMNELLKLKGVTYEWKDPSAHDGDDGTVHGFVAQDVEKVFPSWVKEDGYRAPDGQKYKTLELRQIEALEVESIRTLKAENDSLKAKNDSLEKRVEALESGRRPVVSGINLNGVGFGVGGLAVAGAVMFMGRRKKEELEA